MSRRNRNKQPNQAALLQQLSVQVADLSRRIPAAMKAQGTVIPAHLIKNPELAIPRKPARSPLGDQQQLITDGDATQGIPSAQLMNQMQTNAAPQATPVTMYAPGAPLPVIPGIESPDGPRVRDYPVSINVYALPRSSEDTSFEQLRKLADLYYGIRLCERVWFDVINRLEPKIALKPGLLPDGESEQDAKWQKIIAPALDFVACPDREHSLADWLIMSTGDVLELGQSAIFKARNKAKQIIRLDVVDAATIKPILDQSGRLAQYPYPAFEQYIKGVPAGLYLNDANPDRVFFESDMALITEMARSSSVYGRSRIEDILLVIAQALRLQNLNITRYTDGATPEGMLFVDTSDPEAQGHDLPYWDEVERMLNGQLSGNDRMRSRLKIIPPGLHQYQTTRMEDPHTDFETWLLKLTCGAFGVTMAEIGITDDVNRSSGDSQENVIYRRIVQPLARRYAAFLTQVIQERFDKRLVLTWGGIEEREDTLQKAQTLDILVKNGAISPSRAAREMGYEVDTEVPAFTVFNGGPAAVIVMDDLEELRKMQLQQLQTQLQQAQVAVQTAQAGLKIQQDQGKMLDKQVAQGAQGGDQQPGGPPDQSQGNPAGGDQGNDQGPPPDNGPQGDSNNGGGASPDGGQDDQGASDNSGDQGDDNGPDSYADASAEVDRLIAQAKAKQGKGGKGQAQRVQVADDHEHDFAENRCMVCGCGQPANDHGMPYEVADPDAAPNLGCMVAFFLPGSLGQQLAVDGGERVSDLHITLKMLADDITLTPIDGDALKACVGAWAAQQQPIDIRISGMGRFASDGPQEAVYASVDSAALLSLRADVVAALAGAGFATPDTYGYTPHVTLLYVPQTAPTPPIRVPALSAILTQVWVVYGDQRYAFPLGGGDDDEQVLIVTSDPLTEIRALRADLLGIMTSEEQRLWHTTPVRGAGGKIIDNIGTGRTLSTHSMQTSHHEPGMASGGAHGVERESSHLSISERVQTAQNVQQIVSALHEQFPHLELAFDHSTDVPAMRSLAHAMLHCASICPQAMQHLHFVGSSDATGSQHIMEQVLYDQGGKIGATQAGMLFLQTVNGNYVSDLSPYSLERAASFGILINGTILNTHAATFDSIAHEAIKRDHWGAFATNVPRYLFTHEFGHAIEAYFRRFAPDATYQHWDKFKFASLLGRQDRPTGYAFANEHELFAEGFAASQLGDVAYQEQPFVQQVRELITTAFPTQEPSQ